MFDFNRITNRDKHCFCMCPISVPLGINWVPCGSKRSSSHAHDLKQGPKRRELLQSRGNTAKIEVIANGPSLNMFVAVKSPVADRIEHMRLNIDSLAFKACGTIHKNMSKKLGEICNIKMSQRSLPQVLFA
jgi:hypothetical protein